MIDFFKELATYLAYSITLLNRIDLFHLSKPLESQFKLILNSFHSC